MLIIADSFYLYFSKIYYPIDLVDYIAKVVLILKYQNNIYFLFQIATTLIKQNKVINPLQIRLMNQ
jgi:hypothetical protein